MNKPMKIKSGSKPELLKEGDIIELVKGHKVYTQLPKHAVYINSLGDFSTTETDIKIGDECQGGFKTDYLAGKYIVIKTSVSGGGTGHGSHDVYPDGHCVFCEKIVNKNDHPITVYFYQTGAFTAMIRDIKPIGKATCQWTVEKEKK